MTVGKSKLEIVQEALDRSGQTSRVFATWRTVHEGRAAQSEAHPFRGNGPMLNFRRNGAGVYEMRDLYTFD